MPTKLIRLSTLFTILLFSSLVLAQSSDYTLTRSTVAGGGGFISGGENSYALNVTVGQPLAGTVSANNFTLSTGFWRPSAQVVNRVLAIYALGLDNRSTSP